MTPKLTLNLGVRWDYFGPINETNGGQANFVPQPCPERQSALPHSLFPATGKDNRTLSTTATCLTVLASCYGLPRSAGEGWHYPAADRSVGPGLAADTEGQLRTRVGFAYQVDPKLVVRGGFGLFYQLL